MKTLFLFIFFNFIGFSNPMKVFAESFTTLDTVYTPFGFELGDLTATIDIPNNPNGVGVVIAHGAYAEGPFQRQTMKIWCDTLAANGYLTMSIDYYSLDVSEDSNIDTNAAYPRQVTTFKIAVEFLRRNAKRFNITTNKIVGLGMSGGAIHWGQTIIWDNDDAFFQTDPKIDDHLNAVVLLYGFYDNFNFQPDWSFDVVEKHFALNPDFRATKGNCIANVANITTPLLLIHGIADQNVFYQQSVQLYDSLIELGKTCQLLLFENFGHGFDLTDFFPPHSFTTAGLEAKDTILAFLSRELHLTTTSIKLSQKIVKQFYLNQNYPNPFNPTTSIDYYVPKTSFITIKLFDILGRYITTLVNEVKKPGNYTIEFNARQLTSGIYFYKMQSSDFEQTKKLVLIK